VPRLTSSLIINLAINNGVGQGCPLSFNIYVVRVITDWLQAMKQNILTNDLILNFEYNLIPGRPCDRARTEDPKRKALYALNSTAIKYNLKI
jgi:hypothetical protein